MDAAPAPLAPVEAAALERAVELARGGVGAVEPNPPVGAVVVRDGAPIAEGFHREWGAPHAEAEALAAAGPRANGGTLVVTLEPCSSRGGAKKQPPCVDAVVAAGVRRVVIGALDPDPRHGGAGVAQLRAAGVEVVVVDAPPARALLARFAAHLRKQRPFVVLKWAQGVDGSWASADPAARWISGTAAREQVQRLRTRIDAIVVGSGTVLADDPALTARPPGPRPLVRVIVDPRARIAASARCFVDGAAPTWWVTGAPRAGEPAAPAGVERLPLEAPRDVAQALLPLLYERGVRRLLLEGGPTLAAAFLRAGVVDRAWVFVAPRVVGGTVPSLPPFPPASQARLVPWGEDLWYQLDFD